MGKQVRFYALPKDEALLLEFVRSIPETYRVSPKSSNPTINSFVIPWSKELPKMVFNKNYFCNIKHNALKTYIRRGSYKVYSEEKMDYVDTGEQFYWIDIAAPLVEYTSSFIREDGRLVQGRIWADMYRLEGNEFMYKGDDFKIFYETLAKWIRKNYKRVKGIDGYFGKEAVAWSEGGGNILP
jgi:hypothetical protein